MSPGAQLDALTHFQSVLRLSDLSSVYSNVHACQAHASFSRQSLTSFHSQSSVFASLSSAVGHVFKTRKTTQHIIDRHGLFN